LREHGVPKSEPSAYDEIIERHEALLDKEFFAQDLPKLTPNAETASELISEAI
jgi:hypothetical protein